MHLLQAFVSIAFRSKFSYKVLRLVKLCLLPAPSQPFLNSLTSFQTGLLSGALNPRPHILQTWNLSSTNQRLNYQLSNLPSTGVPNSGGRCDQELVVHHTEHLCLLFSPLTETSITPQKSSAYLFLTLQQWLLYSGCFCFIDYASHIFYCLFSYPSTRKNQGSFCRLAGSFISILPEC